MNFHLKEVVLRKVEVSDSANIFFAIETNREYLKEWMPWVEYTNTEEQETNFLKYVMSRMDEKQLWSGVILYKSQIIGMIDIHHIDYQNEHTQIGYWIVEEYQGKGIVRKILRQVFEKIFEDFNLNKIIIITDVDNQSSIKLAEANNFEKEGYSKEYLKINGTFKDAYFYSLLKKNWKKTKNT